MQASRAFFTSQEGTPRENWSRRLGGPLGTGALAVLFFLALLWRDRMLCWNDDYQISILPVLRDVARSWSEGHWPLLSPYCWACGNLAGEYQYGTFSIFVNPVVVLAWQFHWSYPVTAAAISAAHIFVMAAGGYQLARGRCLSPSLATMVGLIGSLNGWMICWGATDWFGALAALAWLPWAWWALEESLRARGPWRRWLLAAPFVYLVTTGGFPYTVITLGVITLGLLVRAWFAERRLLAPLPLVVGWVLGLGLAAPALFSLFEYMHGSARSQGDGVHHQAWVVPWRSLPGLIAPSWRTWWPDFAGRPFARPAVEMSGSLVPVAALAAAFWERWYRRWTGARFTSALCWDLVFTALALLLCMMPSAGVFRWSFRWLPFFHLALALAGAEALRWWRDSRHTDLPGTVRWWDHPAGWTVGLTAAVALLAPFAGMPHDDAAKIPGRAPAWLPTALLGVALLWALGVVALQRFSKLRGWLPASVTLASLAVTYVLMPTNPRVPRYPFTENLDDPAPLSLDRLYLAFTDAPFIKYHGAEAKPGFGKVLRLGSTAMFSGLHFINGYSPIRAAGVAQAFKLETHGQIDYPHLGELLTGDATGPDGLLARLGIDGIVVAADLPFTQGPAAQNEWEPVFRSDEGVVYHRRGGAMPAATSWMSREPGDTQNLAPVTVKVTADTRDRAVAEVSAATDPAHPVLVAFRRPYFPGYHATFNGKSVAVGSYHGLLPTVELPVGERGGTLVLAYRPTVVVVGAVVSLLTLLVMFVVAWWTRQANSLLLSR